MPITPGNQTFTWLTSPVSSTLHATPHAHRHRLSAASVKLSPLIRRKPAMAARLASIVLAGGLLRSSASHLESPSSPADLTIVSFCALESASSASSKAAPGACNSASEKASLPKAVNAKRPQYRYKLIPVAHASASVIVTSPSLQSVRSVPEYPPPAAKSFTFLHSPVSKIALEMAAL